MTKLHLLERDDFQQETITLKHTIDVIHVNKYNELKDYHKIEVNELLSHINNLKKQVASRESLDVAIAGMTEEVIKLNTNIKELYAYIDEMKEIVNKANANKKN